MNEYNQIVDELRAYCDPQKQIDLPRFSRQVQVSMQRVTNSSVW